MSFLVNLRDRLKKHVRVAIVSLLGLGAGGYLVNDHYQPTTIEAACLEPVGSDVRVEFVVGDARHLGPRIGTLLNNKPYREAIADGNLSDLATVRVPASADGYDLVKDPKAIVGRRVWACGKVTTGPDNRPQIEATEVEIK